MILHLYTDKFNFEIEINVIQITHVYVEIWFELYAVAHQQQTK